MKFLLGLALVCLFFASTEADENKTIVENAINTPALSTLVSVLSMPAYAPILNALNSSGTYTVFAPNNDAFTAAGLDPAQVGKVSNILFYHVLGSVVKSTDLAALQFPETLMVNSTYVNRGSNKAQVVSVSKDKDGVTLNFGIPGVATFSAKVVLADVVCSNGVVHVIDSVLLFPAKVSTTAQDAGLTELVAALTKAKLVDAVDNTPGLTIFAPTNDAMKASQWDALDVDALTAILKYHVVPGLAYSTDLTDGEKFNTLEGKEVEIHIGSSVMVNDANVAVPNALTTNGVVHVIDKVLSPTGIRATNTIVQNAMQVPALSTLVSVLATPGYQPILNALNSSGTFTVFAPNNDAFAAASLDPTKVSYVSQVLYYHVLGSVVKAGDLEALQFPETLMKNASLVNLGGKPQVVSVSKTVTDGTTTVTLNFGIPGVSDYTAQVVTADVICSNGVVHIIDKVLLFPKSTAATAQAAGLTDSELIKALVKADLVSAVDDTSSLTIFAPTNDAMLAANWSNLSKDALASVLQYHVVPDVAYSTDLKSGDDFPTLESNKIQITISNNTVMVNNAKVVVANVLIENGVVHVIDKVLLPSEAPKDDDDDDDGFKTTTIVGIVAGGIAGVAALACLCNYCKKKNENSYQAF
jgi:uncharacterized surface protein with fasciclin (FAS1) repeats